MQVLRLKQKAFLHFVSFASGQAPVFHSILQVSTKIPNFAEQSTHVHHTFLGLLTIPALLINKTPHTPGAWRDQPTELPPQNGGSSYISSIIHQSNPVTSAAVSLSDSDMSVLNACQFCHAMIPTHLHLALLVVDVCPKVDFGTPMIFVCQFFDAQILSIFASVPTVHHALSHALRRPTADRTSSLDALSDTTEDVDEILLCVVRLCEPDSR